MTASLAIRAIAGFLFLFLVLAGVLFVSAGTLDYWQAWLYLLAFFGSSGAITIYLWRADPGLLERRVDAGPLAEPTRSQQIIQSIAALAFVAIYVVAGLDHRFAWSTVPALFSIVAEIVVVVGFWIVYRTFRENTYTAATIEVATEQRVITTGPYATVRHPMYAGALLMLLATPIALASWWALLGFIPILAVIILRLQSEERYLEANLTGYAEYRTRVRSRLLPGVF